MYKVSPLRRTESAKLYFFFRNSADLFITLSAETVPQITYLSSFILMIFNYDILTVCLVGLVGSTFGTLTDNIPSLKLADIFSPSNNSPNSN